MELLETADPAKRRLMEEVRKRREQLDAEAGALARRSSKNLSNGLIIAGVLVGSFLIYKSISAYRKRGKSKAAVSDIKPHPDTDIKHQAKTATPGSGNLLSTRLAQIAVVFLLNLARERVTAWLASKKEPHESA